MTSLQQTAMGGGSATTKTASYVLVAADAGTTVTMTSASATTITVNTALFAAGDTVYIQNLGAGVSTITAGTATVNTSATLALAQYEGGQLYFNSTSAAIFIKGAGAAAASGGMTLISTTTLSGTLVTLSSIPQTYKNLFLVISGVNSSGARPISIAPNAVSNLASRVVIEGTTVVTTLASTIRGYTFTSDASNTSNACAINIYNYASTTTFKPYDTRGSSVASSVVVPFASSGNFASTTAITSLDIDVLGFTMSAGTVLLYGVS
jgi:hypothetical protein